MPCNNQQHNHNDAANQFSSTENAQHQQWQNQNQQIDQNQSQRQDAMPNSINLLSHQERSQLQTRFVQIQQQYPNGAPSYAQEKIEPLRRRLLDQHSARIQLKFQKEQETQAQKAAEYKAQFPQKQRQQQQKLQEQRQRGQLHQQEMHREPEQQQHFQRHKQPQVKNHSEFEKLNSNQQKANMNSISQSHYQNDSLCQAGTDSPKNAFSGNPSTTIANSPSASSNPAQTGISPTKNKTNSQIQSKTANNGLSKKQATTSPSNTHHSLPQSTQPSTSSLHLGTLMNPNFSTPEEVLEVLRGLPLPGDQDAVTKSVEKALFKDSQYEQHMDYVHDRFCEIMKRKRTESQYYSQVLGIRQKQPGALFKGGYMGYGNGWTHNKFEPDVIYPKDRKRNNRVSDELHLNPKQLEETANVSELLVPIRIEIEKDKFYLRDTFTWNLNESSIPVELFAQTLLDDYLLPQSLFTNIKNSIEEQLKEFVNSEKSKCSEPKYRENREQVDEDMRIIVKLDITVGKHNLVDKFEWDINCDENSPEEFAEVMCNEMGLPGEFKTAIAHSIREQSQFILKSLAIVQHPFNGTHVEDEDISRELCSPIVYLTRTKAQLKEYSPVLVEIGETELDRQDKDRDKHSRRKRRQGRTGRRNALALSDFREPLQTFRTPIYSSVLPGGRDRDVELIRRMLEEQQAAENEYREKQQNAHVSASFENGGNRNKHHDRSARGSVEPHSYPKLIGRPSIKKHKISNQNGREKYSTPIDSPSQPKSYIVVLKIPKLNTFLKKIRQNSFQ